MDNYIAGKIIGRSMPDIVRQYLNINSPGQERKFISDLMAKMQQEFRTQHTENVIDNIQQLIFLNLIGYDTSWAEFYTLEVMSLHNYSAKKIAYTFASQLWTPKMEVVLMATSCIHKDLIANDACITSAALSSVAYYLTPALAQHIAHDVISLMNSSQPFIKQKSIITFYHICLVYPEALRPGFSTLREKLDDPEISVVYAALTVLSELCQHNTANFVGMIPKLYKMLEISHSNCISLRLIYMLRMLCDVEPRLQKKLVVIFIQILETTPSVTILYESVRTIIEVPLMNQLLLQYATQRMKSFIEHRDPNLRYLCLGLFIKLMQFQPKLVAKNKEIIGSCLDSPDESIRMQALDLLGALANSKTLDGIVGKMFDHFKSAKPSTKDQIMICVIEMCSRNDYALITDFGWYISILMDFIDVGGFTCYSLVGDQFLDLAVRVPATRKMLVDEMGKLFDKSEFRQATPMILAAAHIISEYSLNSEQFSKVLQPIVITLDQRAQLSCITTAFVLYLRSQSQTARGEIERMFDVKLPLLETSQFEEVQDFAMLTLNLVHMIKEAGFDAIYEMNTLMMAETPDEIVRPKELDEPLTIFLPDADDDQFIYGDEILPERTTNNEKEQEGIILKKPKQKRRRQIVAERPVVLDTKDKVLNIEQIVKKDSKPLTGVISNALAEVDLTEAVAESEAKAIQAPTPYNQAELMKKSKPKQFPKPKAQNNQTQIPKRRRRRIESKSNDKQEQKQKTPKVEAVTGPLPNSRRQTFGSVTKLQILADDFTCDQSFPHRLTINFSVNNNTVNAIQSMSIEMNADSNVKANGLSSITNPIEPKQSCNHQVAIEVTDILKPHILKFRFIPFSDSADTVDADVRIFPSFFLVAGDASTYETAIPTCRYTKQETYTCNMKPKEILQCIINVLRGIIIQTEYKNLRVIYSKSILDHNIICTVKIEQTNAVIELKTSNEALSEVLNRELKMKINALSR